MHTHNTNVYVRLTRDSLPRESNTVLLLLLAYISLPILLFFVVYESSVCSGLLDLPISLNTIPHFAGDMYLPMMRELQTPELLTITSLRNFSLPALIQYAHTTTRRKQLDTANIYSYIFTRLSITELLLNMRCAFEY